MEEPQQIVKLLLTLASHWTNTGQWDKALDHLKRLAKVDSRLEAIYELLDVEALKENPQVIGESLPIDILKDYLTLKVWLGKGRTGILETVAQKLLDKIRLLPSRGHKGEEIAAFCSRFLSQPALT